MEPIISSSISQIPPSTLFSDGFELVDQNIIPSENLIGSFDPNTNKVELFIYDINQTLLDSSYNFNNWTITKNSDTSGLNNTDTLQIDPSEDLIKGGYDVGELYAVYNFVNYELSTSPSNLLYISEISSDRTEIKLNSNFISNEDLESTFNVLKSKIDDVNYFDEFYVSSFGNNYNIGVNLLLDKSTSNFSILIKLYDALPDTFLLKDEIYVATKISETLAYKVEFYNDSENNEEDIPYLKGPNYNLEIKDFVNNSTTLKSKSELLDAYSTDTNNNLQNHLNQKGVKITPNYSFSTFNEFVNFSSAKKRIENFYEKVTLIQSYEDDINTIKSSITGPTKNTPQVSSSLASAATNIESIIKNLDGYEYSLYYTSGSSAYPKLSGSSFPYTLQNTGSTEVLKWLGSDVENSANYGGIILSASLYDEDNQNWLYYTIPEFIRDNNDNVNYIEFSNMVGQHFDEIWMYTKAVSEKSNTTNDLDKGVPLKLAQEVIKSLGYEGFGNNFASQNNYMGLLGEENGSYVPSTGNEIIDNYIAINNGSVVNYWGPTYSHFQYVQQLGEKGFPYPIDKVSKEIYKRLYHNMSYLAKKKGTISGLRQLINIWGIPDTVLRINEFGGKNKDNTDDYDYWYNRYSYAFSPITNQNVASASAIFPWMPLERNRITNNEYIVPDNLQFRFKTTGYPSSSYAGEFFSQSLAVKKSDGDETSTNFDFGIGLFYTGSATGSYSGSNNTTYRDWGVMRFYISGSPSEGGTVVSNDIYLPFYDKGWWSVMLQRDTHPSASVHTTDTNYTLYVKNKTYNGKDRNQIAFQGSASITIPGSTSSSINESWNKFGTGSHDGIYLGGLVSGSNVGPHTLNTSGKMFSGSFQEFRYYSNDIPETVFNDFVMNPESIEGNNVKGLESSFDIVNFRAPLGNELETKFITSISSSHTESLTSFHPAVSAKSTLLITGSFVNPNGNITSSNYHIQYYENLSAKVFSQPNTEVYFLDQPSVGIRNRISNKIEVDVNNDNYGKVLSNQISTEQDYEISRSYTDDIPSLEVAFSPQDNLNDDIIQAFGHGIISDSLADPRFISSSSDYYPKLRESAEYYLQKYTEGNIYDYVRLIKYIDNSLFRAIKAYVPARTSVSTGIIIKQHMLERNRFTPPSMTTKSPLAVTPETGSSSSGYNSPLIYQDLQVSTSIDVGKIKGGAGGVVNKFNYSGSPNFLQTPITQSYTNTFDTALGLQTIVEDTEKEFYDGEYSGSKVIATTQDRFLNPFKNQPEDLGFINFNASSITLDNQLRNVVTNINGGITSQGIFKVVGNKIKINSNTSQNIQLDFHSISLGNGTTASPGGYNSYGLNSQFKIVIKVVGDKGTNETFNILKNTNSGGVSSNFLPSLGCFVSTPSFQVKPLESLTIEYGTSIPGSVTTVTNVKETNVNIRAVNKWGDQTLNQPPPLPYGEFTLKQGTNLVIVSQVSNTPNLLLPSDLLIGRNETESSLLPSSTFVGGNFTLKKNQTNAGVFLILNEGGRGSDGAFVDFRLIIQEVRDYTTNAIILNQDFKLITSTIERGIISSQTFSPPSYPFNLTSTKVFISNNESVSLTIIPPYLPPGGIQTNFSFKGINLNLNSFEIYSPIWDNSEYNALNNNFNLNRPNSFLQIIDNSSNSGSSLLPINIDQINTNSAIKSSTPDSNYTMRRITRPRYEGSRVQSVDYNVPTPPSSNITFLNGDTGSWSGDTSFGSTAVIDKNPIFFAHFKSSNESKPLLGSYLFKVDALIQLPFEDITGKTKTTEIPPIIKLDGSNKNLYEVSNTFESGREAIISYDILRAGDVDLSTLSVGSNKIFQGGIEYKLVNGSYVDDGTFISTQSYITASGHIKNIKNKSNQITNSFPLGNDSRPPLKNNLLFLSASLSPNVNDNEIELDYYMYNMTDPVNNPVTGFDDAGRITLGGPPIKFSQSMYLPTLLYSGGPQLQGGVVVSGASLAILNTINTRITLPFTSSVQTEGFNLTTIVSSSIGLTYAYSASINPIKFTTTINNTFSDVHDGTIGLGGFMPKNMARQLWDGYYPDYNPVSPENFPTNFFYYNISESFDGNYESNPEKFQIKPGDELSIIYTPTDALAGSGPSSPSISLSFTILDIVQSEDPAIKMTVGPNATGPVQSYLGDGRQSMSLSSPYSKWTFSNNSVFDQLIVTPTPPNDMKAIRNFTIRRRVQADDRIMIFQSPPQNSNGAATPTGEGFIIPNDCTPQQKRNALTLISQLKGTNTFKE